MHTFSRENWLRKKLKKFLECDAVAPAKNFNEIWTTLFCCYTKGNVVQRVRDFVDLGMLEITHTYVN